MTEGPKSRGQDYQIGKLSKPLHSVTNVESLFPAMLVLWLEREFYRGKYGMTGSIQAWTPDLCDHLGDKFVDEIWDLKGAGFFSLSLLGEEIRLNVLDDSM
ncbi:hypothetical protein AVEN_127616-1 [Araneus ventricosus]|uniref:Uncharacterized protein n=1 Tax=Araneus ventricosus TaxID=182803 RepID=A0A4Y2B049_ARAVE|nr:hypothetical protein AVEN_239028-1 [Araneus ventricosus]GBL84464.1 hypothetical protein AVEN_127616-1 [Araneus ventricosus]